MKIKSMRENLREHNILQDYLEKHPYGPAYKLHRRHQDPGKAFEPLRNYLDVSVMAMGLQSAPVWHCRALALTRGASQSVRAGTPISLQSGESGPCQE